MKPDKVVVTTCYVLATAFTCIVTYAMAKRYVDEVMREWKQGAIEAWHAPYPFQNVTRFGKDVNEAVAKANA